MNKKRAKDLLVHYFRVVFEAADIEWSCDNQTEIEEIIDAIIEATKEETG